MATPMRARLAVPVSERDHVRGPKTAPVTLVEYGDYECPYCGAANTIVSEVLKEVPDLVRYVFRHFPLSEVHPHAKLAAEAAEAAGAQHKFWEMHETLFENQRALELFHLAQYAADLELDVPRFVRELEEGVYRERVREDFLSGVRSGVNGTPTFFINGIRHDGSWQTEALLAAIRRAAGEAGA